MADALGSVVVIISALLNIYHEYVGISRNLVKYIDPIMCLGLVMIILTTTIPLRKFKFNLINLLNNFSYLVKESAFILLQTVPKDIELNQLKKDLNEVKGILNVHELHIWKLSGNKIIASAHITCHSLEEYMKIAAKVKKLFHEKGIHSTTIQPEFIDVRLIFKKIYFNKLIIK
jgi:Co/Zn/Cd efflux system component